MKKIVCFILFNFLFLLNWSVFSENTEKNTEENIKKAILVEDYISKHKEKIEDFLKKYDLNDKSNIESDLKVLNESLVALKKIENTDISKEKAEEVIQAILVRIKNVNESLKNKLKIEKSNFEQKLNIKTKVYSALWEKLAKKIDEINLKTAQNIFKNKKVLSLKESRIKQNLINLNKESQKLKNFWNISFNSENEIQDSFVRILNNIKREVNSMKSNLK